ncbi:MAG TPA: NAD-dependent epimerase/dehydratase family protein [Anaerolineae bacterium]
MGILSSETPLEVDQNAEILVTGATGFTGGHLARTLASRGQAVRALVRDCRRAAHLQALGVELAYGDLLDPVSLKQAMFGIDTVYHIAATFREEKISEETMWATNAQGVQYMLDAAVGAGVRRFVHCSTVGVHGEIENPPADENAPYKPEDRYQESKVAGEKIALDYMRRGKLPVVIVRPAGIYGPGDTRFLKLFKAVKWGYFVMLGSGKVLYQLVYIDDLVDGIILCGTVANAVGNVYILTGEPAVTLTQLMAGIAEAVGTSQRRLWFPITPVYLAAYVCELVCRPLGIEPPLYRRRVDFFRKDRAFSIEKARRELGFVPKVDLKAGLKRTAEWYEAQGLM